MLETLFVWSGILVGAGLASICAADLVAAWPFERASLVFDVGFLTSGALLTYCGYDAKRSNNL